MKTKTPKTQSVYCDARIDDERWKRDIFLPPNQTYVLILDYPLGDEFLFKFKTGKNGMGTIALIGVIQDKYKIIYRDEKSQKSYGVWGHDIGDLVVEGIKVNHVTKKVTVDVGS